MSGIRRQGAGLHDFRAGNVSRCVRGGPRRSSKQIVDLLRRASALDQNGSSHCKVRCNAVQSVLHIDLVEYVCKWVIIKMIWCREGGSNPHGREGRRILSPLRLPVPPSRPGVGACSKSIAQGLAALLHAACQSRGSV